MGQHLGGPAALELGRALEIEDALDQELGMLDLLPRPGRLLGSTIPLADFGSDTDHDVEAEAALPGRGRS